MEFKDIIEKYIKIFIMVLQVASDRTGNSVYKDVESIIGNSFLVKKSIEEERPIPEIITYMISCIITRVHGNDVYGVEGQDHLNRMIEDLYIRYLKGPTNAFLKKNGLPVINSLNETGYLTIYKK